MNQERPILQGIFSKIEKGVKMDIPLEEEVIEAKPKMIILNAEDLPSEISEC